MAELTALTTALAAALTSAGLKTFVGEPTPGGVTSDAAGLAQPYVCLYPGAGVADATTESLAATPGVSQIEFSVTVASGYVLSTLRAAETVGGALLGQWFAGVGPVRQSTATSVMADRSVQPARWFVNLVYVASVGLGNL